MGISEIAKEINEMNRQLRKMLGIITVEVKYIENEQAIAVRKV